MPDISDAQTYCCDRPECQVPVVLSALVTVGKEHWCRPCWQRLHPVTEDTLNALYDFAFGAPEDAFTAPIEQVNAELRDAGIDPDEVTRRVVDRLAEVGIRLPVSSVVPCPDAPRDPRGTAPAAATADPGSRMGET